LTEEAWSEIFVIEPLGECAAVIRLGESIDEHAHRRVLSITDYLEKRSFIGWIEAVPSYTAITIHYDLFAVFNSRILSEQQHLSIYETVSSRLSELLQHFFSMQKHASFQPLADAAPTVIIPVCYGGEYGPDLQAVAEHCGMTRDEVIQLHSGTEYLVYMIGFAPGFPYLGGMPERLAMPRRAEPRLVIPAGSVGIAASKRASIPMLPLEGGS